MRTRLLPLLLLLCAGPARGIEVSIEENKVSRGSVGFVDLQRLFHEYPETHKARQQFEDVMRQAEEQVNLRKAKLLRKKAQLVELRMQHGLLSITPIPAARAAPAPDGSTAAAHGSGVAASTSAASGVALSSGAPAWVQEAGAGAPGLANLPGLSQEDATVLPAQLSSPSVSGLSSLEAALAEQAEQLKREEDEFRAYQAQVERNLLDLESRKSEILLGKIYAAAQEVARAEGVSVVVDKSQILVGHPALDLTEKVLQRLKASQP